MRPACLWPIFPYMQKFWKDGAPCWDNKTSILTHWATYGFGVKNNQFIPKFYSIKGSTSSLVHEMRPGRTDRHPATSKSARRSLGSTFTIAKAGAAAIAQTQKFRSYPTPRLHKPKIGFETKKQAVCLSCSVDNGRNVFNICSGAVKKSNRVSTVAVLYHFRGLRVVSQPAKNNLQILLPHFVHPSPRALAPHCRWSMNLWAHHGSKQATKHWRSKEKQVLGWRLQKNFTKLPKVKNGVVSFLIDTVLPFSPTAPLCTRLRGDLLQTIICWSSRCGKKETFWKSRNVKPVELRWKSKNFMNFQFWNPALMDLIYWRKPI